MAVETRPPPALRRHRFDHALEFASILLGTALAFLVLESAFGDAQQNFEELALGAETRSLYAQVDGRPIHCRDMTDVAACLEGHAQRGGGPAVVWLGNSQLHAVNQLQPGQENAAPLLFRRLGERGLDLLAFSQPNANLQEHLVLFAYLQPRLPMRALILPLVFDDLREIGVRASLTGAFEDPRVHALLERHAVGRSILARQGQQGAGDMAALYQTVQEHSELALNDWLEEHSALWALRPQARGALFSNLYILRNSLLGITAQSKRSMIPGRMQLNLDAARAILVEAKRAGIPVLAYVVPLRNDVATPYIEGEYARFKQQMEELVTGEGGHFANLEQLVPAELWGQKRSTNLEEGQELDFMHFQAGGHALLAAAVGDLLDPILDGASR